MDNWYDTLTPECRESVFTIMRKWSEKASGYYERFRKLQVPYGYRSVGAADWDEWIRYDCISNYLRYLNGGYCPAKSFKYADGDRVVAISKHNDKWKDYQLQRWIGHARDTLESILRDVNSILNS